MMKDSKQNILLVDDTSENIDILNEVLSNYHRFIALNGEKAIQLATSVLPDLILLDIVMPGMDGYQVCKVLREQEQTRHIPIIFITSRSDPQSIVKGFEAGAVDYVTKPFNIKELKSRVVTQLALKKSRDDIQDYLKEIEHKNKLITDSINYAKRIQEASLPDMLYLNEIMDEYFIIYKPKDIVSGDFYWIREVNEKLIIIIADCTGHGVPGAFMSMFGTVFLNEIINRDNITRPNLILNKLRKRVITSLKQNNLSKISDGMDMSIITIDRGKNKLEFAGAKNKLYYIRNNELHQIKADKMPVSIHPIMEPFNNQEMVLRKNDVFYLLSDGFTDQFGGEKNEKIGISTLKQLLNKNNKENLEYQKRELEIYFDKWKGEEEQTDDVLVFGIKI